MPVIVVVIGCQPIDHDGNRTDLRLGPSLDHPTLPLALITALVGGFLCCLKHLLLQNKGPSHSPYSDLSAIFLPQLGCIMLSQSGSWHFSKLLSTF